jgi:hypothetical protein
MNRRGFNIAAVNAEVKAQVRIAKFTQEFEQNGNQNQGRPSAPVRQNNNAQGVVPPAAAQVQQPVYGG